MFGLLNLHKPAGVTSRDVVNQVQRLVRPVKLGHAGTLDPLATGVLIVCLGPATRLVEYVQRMPKRYVGTFLLGRQSDTEDVEGTVEVLENPRVPTRAELEDSLPRFVGEIQQVPPAFSALKVKGQRAYDLARRGADVELAPRPVQIHELRLLDYNYPELSVEILCGSGTYVRSLGRDLARALGTEAVMSALVRRAIGHFRVEEAVSPDQLSRENVQQYLLPPQQAVADIPTVRLSPEEVEHLRHGRPIFHRFSVTTTEVVGIASDDSLAAILQTRGGKLWPLLSFLKPV